MNDKTFWALCHPCGAVNIGEDGRAMIFGSRKEARRYLAYVDTTWEKLHVEKVEVL